MTEKTNTSTLVDRYFEATQSNNVATWAACFAPDATVDDPVGSPPIKGTDAILERGKEFMANFQTVGLYPEYVSIGDRLKTPLSVNSKHLTVNFSLGLTS